ncbi:hypothetical protein HJG60_011802 [Phyllostomus discolor]|uniref:Uncharacterized protein n=1 Tax=Phyllostomus discolor TaxID=89673 RepID=A0A833ZCX1_9CHIR|nr:hypothetical protein HJG60_011802 [Phyllostomus discolor]
MATLGGKFTKCDFFPPYRSCVGVSWVLIFITAPPTVRVRECGGDGCFLGWPKPHAGKRHLGEGLPGFLGLEALTGTLWTGTVPSGPPARASNLLPAGPTDELRPSPPPGCLWTLFICFPVWGSGKPPSLTHLRPVQGLFPFTKCVPGTHHLTRTSSTQKPVLQMRKPRLAEAK